MFITSKSYLYEIAQYLRQPGEATHTFTASSSVLGSGIK